MLKIISIVVISLRSIHIYNKHNLRWLHVSMSYNRFNNLGELFQGHLNSLIMKTVELEGYCYSPCNFPDQARPGILSL
jgi:hypothetical protein